VRADSWERFDLHENCDQHHEGAHRPTPSLDATQGEGAGLAIPGDRSEQPSPSDDWRPLMLELSGIDVRVCPTCNQPTLERRALPDPRGRAPPVTA